MSFPEWQAQYAAHGIATFPVTVGPGGKKPLVSNYARFGLRASAAIAEKFSDATGIGFMVGARSHLTILDVDSPDKDVLADALSRHGQTPLVVRSGSGNYQAWYRYSGELRLIRPYPDQAIDILGDGFVVAPPSQGVKTRYQFVEGSLDDLDNLPVLRGIEIAPSPLSTVSTPDWIVAEGSRNKSLWRHCMKAAHHCDDLDALLDLARTKNAEFSPPLPDAEVLKVASSAWRYTERGDNRFGRPGVFFDTTEANDLIGNDSDLYLMLSLLRANNKPDSRFMATNKGLAKKLRWRTKRVAETRRRMIAKGYAEQISKARPKHAALYRWIKGSPK
jgi:Bifunctional DNA primase/polymerase, N-terminal/Primase C terminal 1 (PriCT-1)